MSISVVLSLCFAGISAYITSKSGTPFNQILYGALAARVMSWLVWFPLWTLMPCLGFQHAWMQEARKAHNSEHVAMAEARHDSSTKSASVDKVSLQDLTCATLGCMRPPCNRKVGETCCRTCESTGGKRHGPACEQRWSRGSLPLQGVVVGGCHTSGHSRSA